MPSTKEGNTLQSGLYFYEQDFMHQHMPNSVLGIVLNVYCSNDTQNRSAIPQTDLRGSSCEARVLIINDGKDASWILPNVVVTPQLSSGIDNFYEELPRGSSQMIDGSDFNERGQRIDITKYDGDFCIVDFVGGSIEQPYIVSWWPHPYNRFDPATIDAGSGEVLDQGRRLARRFQGTKFVVTAQGSIFVDTSQANSELQFAEQDFSQPIKRLENEVGGDVQIDVKQARQLQVNFNPVVALPESQPSLIQPNKAGAPKVDGIRATSNTTLTLDQSFIRAVAGQVVELFAAELLLLGKEGEADEPMVLGNLWRSMMDDLINALLNHKHPTGLGPSGISLELVTDLPGVQAQFAGILSDWIRGQKTAPTP